MSTVGNGFKLGLGLFLAAIVGFFILMVIGGMLMSPEQVDAIREMSK